MVCILRAWEGILIDMLRGLAWETDRLTFPLVIYKLIVYKIPRATVACSLSSNIGHALDIVHSCGNHQWWLSWLASSALLILPLYGSYTVVLWLWLFTTRQSSDITVCWCVSACEAWFEQSPKTNLTWDFLIYFIKTTRFTVWMS